MNGTKRFGFGSVAWSASMAFSLLPNMAFERDAPKVAPPQLYIDPRPTGKKSLAAVFSVLGKGLLRPSLRHSGQA